MVQVHETHQPLDTPRDAWERAVQAEAAKVQAAQPALWQRCQDAVSLIFAGKVQLAQDGTATVASRTDPTLTYGVNGACGCLDAKHTAPDGLCAHRLAVGLMKRAQASVTKAETPAPSPQLASYIPGHCVECQRSLGQRCARHEAAWKVARARQTPERRCAGCETLLTEEEKARMTAICSPCAVGILQEDARGKEQAAVRSAQDAPTPQEPRHSIAPEHIVHIQGKPFVTCAGLLALAHARGMTSLTADWTYNDASLSLAHAVAVFPFGRFEESGDASPDNVTKKVAQHFRRVALTRAKARVLRDALNVDMVSLEELSE